MDKLTPLHCCIWNPRKVSYDRSEPTSAGVEIYTEFFLCTLQSTRKRINILSYVVRIRNTKWLQNVSNHRKFGGLLLLVVGLTLNERYCARILSHNVTWGGGFYLTKLEKKRRFLKQKFEIFTNTKFFNILYTCTITKSFYLRRYSSVFYFIFLFFRQSI